MEIEYSQLLEFHFVTAQIMGRGKDGVVDGLASTVTKNIIVAVCEIKDTKQLCLVIPNKTKLVAYVMYAVGGMNMDMISVNITTPEVEHKCWFDWQFINYIIYTLMYKSRNSTAFLQGDIKALDEVLKSNIDFNYEAMIAAYMNSISETLMNKDVDVVEILAKSAEFLTRQKKLIEERRF